MTMTTRGVRVELLPLCAAQTPGRRRANATARAVRIEVAHAGGGVYVALVLDPANAVLEVITGGKREVSALAAERWPGIRVALVPFIREENPGRRSRIRMRKESPQ